MTMLETHTGAYLDYADPQASQILVEDVAHALSQICRFGGHTSRFYSVAEHALLVYSLVPERGLAALHHDSHEAYVCDAPTPLKALLPGFREVAADIDRAVAAAFGLDVAAFKDPALKAADQMAMRIEARELKASRGVGRYWGFDEEPLLAAPWRLGMSPEEAKGSFLDLHRDLMEASR